MNASQDTYGYRHLAHHLIRSGRSDILRRWLMDIEWLETKLSVTDPLALIDDYNLALDPVNLSAAKASTGSRDLEANSSFTKHHKWQALDIVVQNSVLETFSRIIRRQAHVLDRNRELLWQQLYNEIQWLDPMVRELFAFDCESRSQKKAKPWLYLKTHNQEAAALVRTLAGHDAGISVVTVDSSGDFTVTGDVSGLIKVWDIQTGIERNTYEGHKEHVTHCVISPDGKSIISASHDKNSQGDLRGSIRRWDIATLKEVFIVPLTNRLSGDHLAISRDTSKFVTVESRPIIKLWNWITGREIVTLRADFGYVDSSIVSSTSDWILVADRYGFIRIFNCLTGEEKSSIKAHDGTISICAISPSGDFFVSSGSDHVLKVWNTNDGQNYLTLNGHSAAVTNCIVSSDGKLIISGGKDSKIIIWDAQTGQKRLVLRGHHGPIKTVCLSVDSAFLVSTAEDDSLHVWDIHIGQQRAILHGHTAPPVPAKPQSEKKPLQFWDTLTGKLTTLDLDETTRKKINAIAISPDSRVIVSSGNDHTVRIWDSRSGSLRNTLRGHTDAVTDCKISPDGLYIVSASSDHSLIIWNLKSGRLLKKLEGHTSGIYACGISTDGSRIGSIGYDETFRLWNLRTGEQMSCIDIAGLSSVPRSAFNRDLSLLATVMTSYQLLLWNGYTGELEGCLAEHYGYINDVVISEDGSQVVSASQDKTLQVWNTDVRNLESKLHGHLGSVTACALSSDQRHVISHSDDHTVKLWDLRTAQVIRTIAGFDDNTPSFLLNQDRLSMVVRIQNNNILEVWDISEDRHIASLQCEMKVENFFVLNPAGDQLAAIGSDAAIHIWNLKTGAKQAVLYGHGRSITACQFTLDGRFLISGSQDKSTKVWDVNIAQFATSRFTHTSIVTNCVFSKDGSIMATSSHDGTIKIWDAETGDERTALEVGSDWLVDHLLISSDNRFILAASNSSYREQREEYASRLDIWDAQAGHSHFYVAGHKDRINSFRLSPNNDFAVTASQDSSLRIWDIANGRLQAILQGHSGPVIDCVISRDGRKILSIGLDGSLLVWDVASARMINRYQRQYLSFLDDGRYIVAALDDYTFTAWDVETGYESATMVGYHRPAGINLGMPTNIRILLRGTVEGGLLGSQRLINGRVSPDGRVLVANSYSNAFTIRDIQSGGLLGVKKGRMLNISADANYAVSIHSEKVNMLELWDLRSGTRIGAIPLLSSASSAAFHPTRPLLLCGDEAGNVYIMHIFGFEYGSSVVDAVERDSQLSILCPNCHELQSISIQQLNQESRCSSAGCDAKLRINPIPISVELGFAPLPTLQLHTRTDNLEFRPVDEQTGTAWLLEDTVAQCQAKDQCTSSGKPSRKSVISIGMPNSKTILKCRYCGQYVCGTCSLPVKRWIKLSGLIFIGLELCCPRCKLPLGDDQTNEFFISSPEHGVFGILEDGLKSEAPTQEQVAKILEKIRSSVRNSQRNGLVLLSKCTTELSLDDKLGAVTSALLESPMEPVILLYKILLSAKAGKAGGFSDAMQQLEILKLASRMPDFPPVVGLDMVAKILQDLSITSDGMDYSSNIVLQLENSLNDFEQKLISQGYRIFNSDLLSFDNSVHAHQSRQLSLGRFTKQLFSEESNIPLVVRNYLNATHLEDTLNFNTVEAERSQLIAVLVHRLEPVELNELVQNAANLKLGTISTADFYSDLQRLTAEMAVSLNPWPALTAYFEYITLAASIDHAQLFTAIWQQTLTRYDEKIKTNEERRIVEESIRLYLIRQLAQIVLSDLVNRIPGTYPTHPEAQEQLDKLTQAAENKLSIRQRLQARVESIYNAMLTAQTQYSTARSSTRQAITRLKKIFTEGQVQGGIDYFPGMPLLSFHVKNRLRYYLPDSKLMLKLNLDNSLKHTVDAEVFTVNIDDEIVGRFTIRKKESSIERNFFCILPVSSVIPKEAIEQGSFGTGGPEWQDNLRIVFEYLQVVIISILEILVPRKASRSSAPGLLSNQKRLSLHSVYHSEQLFHDPLVEFSQYRCDIDKTLFVVPSYFPNLQTFGSPESAYFIDIGGYCPTCRKYLCPKHLRFQASLGTDQGSPKTFTDVVLVCEFCGTKVVSPPH